MPAAILIPALVGAGSAAASVVGAKMASGAAKDAAATQSSAADRSLAFQREQWNKQNEQFAPYLKAGQSAVGNLTDLANPTNRFSQAQQFQQPFVAPGRTTPLYTPTGGPRPQGLADMAQPPPGPLSGGGTGGSVGSPMMPPPPQGPGPGQGPGQGQMVMMQGPDGSKGPVPADRVRDAIARGGKVIG